MTATMNTDPAVMPTQAKARLSPAGPAAPDITVVVLDSDASATIGSTFLCYRRTGGLRCICTTSRHTLALYHTPVGYKGPDAPAVLLTIQLERVVVGAEDRFQRNSEPFGH